MAHATKTDVLAHGTTLVRHYDDAYPSLLEHGQCGALADYQAYENQFVDGPMGYYLLADGTSKFLRHVAWHIWSPMLQNDTSAWPAGFGGADCADGGDGSALIRLMWFDPAAYGSYKLPAALSHEMGHALAAWSQVFHADRSWGTDFRHLWELQVTTDHVNYGATTQPWYDPSGQRRTENADEQWANAGRYFLGTNVSPGDTRGSTGPAGYGGPDPVIAGFESPAYHPEWGKQMAITPETTAFMAHYGYMPGTLSWQTGAGGYWLFRRSDGTWVAQTNYYVWFQWVNGAWQQYMPAYDRG